MPLWSRAMLIAGAFCAIVCSLGNRASADTTADAIRHADAMLSVPLPTPTPDDPCDGRGWSPAHPLRFCGRIRLVPADAPERDLWWGEHVSELADAYFSAEGQHALFSSRQVVISGLAPQAVLGRRADELAIRGQAWTIARVQGVFSPAQAEANPFVRPFAAGGIGGYMLGFLTMDIGQSMLAHMPANFGLRTLDEVSRRSILTQDIDAHIAGADSWVPILQEGNSVNAMTQACTALAEQSLTYGPHGSITIAPAPRRCASIWPVIRTP